ncbi:MAG TPA: protein translocase subunit SecD [Spirochaetaceae bacterium]|nr:protein translocase subunit SecD [Spirochaetaceae bacterium]
MNRVERSAIILIVIALACYLLYPTLKWNVLLDDKEKSVAVESNGYIRDYCHAEVRMMRQDIEAEADDLTDLSGKYVQVVKAASKSKVSPESGKWTKSDLLSAMDSGAGTEIERQMREHFLALKRTSGKSLKFGLDLRGGLSVLLEADGQATESRTGSRLSADEISTGLDDDVELLRRRVDEFGISEVDIHRQGIDQIVIEMPGTSDPERVNSLLKNSGSLKFSIVDADKSSQLASDVASNSDKYIDINGNFISQSFQEGFTAYGYYEQDDLGSDVLAGQYVLDDNQSMDAIYMRTVEVSRDQITGRPAVNFTMSSEGGELFYDITSKNVGRLLVVVFDGRIKNVATIRSALSTNVQVTGFNAKEAEELSVTLKSSALPVDLKVVSSQSVGASLGEDSIRQIFKSIVIGMAILAIFLLAYYHLAGLLSVVLLGLNLVLVVSVLSSFGFTLSLTSIAGVILTIGMAADSSIIIFERIKEELRKGVVPFNAVRVAYGKAMWTILDANITTMIAALVLSMLGATSVKGFAVTLAIGIVCTLITMLFTSHLVFDLFVRSDAKRISVGFNAKKEDM